jgi:4-aminobutyrate---pyruvate transaminase
MHHRRGPALTRTQSRDMACHLHGQSYVSSSEQTPPMVILRGEGVHVWDETGRKYLDAMAGVGNATLGYSESRLIEAASQQLRRLPFHHTFGNRTTEQTAELAERLVLLAPGSMEKAFFACSGSEANDSAIMLAWYYWRALGQPSRRKILSYQRAYHGSTVATASLSDFASLQQAFGLPLPGFIHVRCPNHYREALPGENEHAFAERLAAELEEAIVHEGPETVAAFFVEPVMGLGGIVVPPAGFSEKIQAVIRRHGILIVADEVVAGFGRTGNFWGCESVGLQPDMLVCSKGLTAGYMPMSAVVLSETVCEALRRNTAVAFGHGFTQGGNPVSAAVALETLKIYEERDLVAHARAMGERFAAGLHALGSHPLVGDVRGIGMMWAIELVSDKATRAPFDPAWGIGLQAAQFAQSQGVIVRMVGDCLVTLPPLITGINDVERIIAVLGSAIDRVAEIAARLREQSHRARGPRTSKSKRRE